MTLLATLNLDTVHLTDDQFYQLCQSSRDLRFERIEGVLVIMTPVGGESGNKEAGLIGSLRVWNEQSQQGFVFSSSTDFKLPNGGDRSPDAAWVRRDRWEALTPNQRQNPPIAPNFVIELRSATVRAACPQDFDLETLQDKMQKCIENGVHLGWLINPQDQRVEVYRQGGTVELSGEAVLPEFTLRLS